MEARAEASGEKANCSHTSPGRAPHPTRLHPCARRSSLCHRQRFRPILSAAFYEKVFGWHIERPYPSFEAPGLIGQWVTDRPVARGAGLLAWITVDDIDASLDLARANGGQVLELPSVDGTERWLATITDPPGNAVGIVQHGSRR